MLKLFTLFLACSATFAQTAITTDQLRAKSPAPTTNKILMIVIGPNPQIVEVGLDPASLILTGTGASMMLKAITPAPVLPTLKVAKFANVPAGTMNFTVTETSTATVQEITVYRNGIVLSLADDYTVAVTPGVSITITLVAAQTPNAGETFQVAYKR